MRRQTKRRLVFGEIDEPSERVTNKAGDKAASCRERKLQSGYFLLVKPTKGQVELPKQLRDLWGETIQASNRQRDR
jgi:hypothetical protein